MREPAPALVLGEGGMPALLASVRLGMDWPELLRVRPKAYQSSANATVLHEELGGGTSAHYTVREEALHAVMIRGSGRAKEANDLRSAARMRFGVPFDFAGGKLYRAGHALLRIEVDMGNLILELSDARNVKPAATPPK